MNTCAAQVELNPKKRSVLMLGASKGWLNFTKALLDRGANISATDARGFGISIYLSQCVMGWFSRFPSLTHRAPVPSPSQPPVRSAGVLQVTSGWDRWDPIVIIPFLPADSFRVLLRLDRGDVWIMHVILREIMRQCKRVLGLERTYSVVDTCPVSLPTIQRVASRRVAAK